VVENVIDRLSAQVTKTAVLKDISRPQ